MIRADLLALTPDKLAALSNRGLVKRAQKMLEEGQGPTLETLADGTVVARDGPVETTLPPGVPIEDARCTCNSLTICRHRIAAVLAYASAAGEGPPSRGRRGVSTRRPARRKAGPRAPSTRPGWSSS